MNRLVIVVVASFLVVGQTSRSITDGVFTAAQAERGRARYAVVCQSCHGPKLGGGAGGALVGEAFIRRWSGLSLDHLADRVRTMPPQASEPPGDAAVHELIALILLENSYQAGAIELNAENVRDVRIEGRGSDEVPNFSLVAIVGCLARSGERGWTATGAAEPFRTRNPDASSGDEKTRAASMPRGTRTYVLMNVFPSPEQFDGQLVEAKGFLIRGSLDSLNVTSVTSLATRCDP